MEWYWWLGSVCSGLTLLVILVIVWFAVDDSRKRTRILREGEHVHAWLVQANSKLFEKLFLNDPALVLISPDETTANDRDFMTDLAARVFALKGIDPDDCKDKDDAFVAELVFDEAYSEGKRDRLPKRFAQGREVYLAHIYVYRGDLPGEKISRRRLAVAVIWDDPKAMICTCPALPRKHRDDDDEGGEDGEDGRFTAAFRR